MADSSHWYVVHTHAQAEITALRNLARQGFEVYLPRYLRKWRHARRVEFRPAALFPRYLFVRLDVSAARWRAILSTTGVSTLICRGEEPASVPHGIIEQIREREDQDGIIRLRDLSFNKGDRLQVTAGPLESAIGLFEGLAENDRVVLLLDLLGREMRVTLPFEAVAAPA